MPNRPSLFAMEDLAEVVRRRAAAGEDLAVGRVLKVEGFSTLPGTDGGFVLVDVDGTVQGGPFEDLGGAQLVEAARKLFASQPASQTTEVTLDVGDKEAVSAGLACGGRVELVLQVASALPPQLWESLVAREPVALLTWLEEPKVALVGPGGRVLGHALSEELLDTALRALREGQSSNSVIEDEGSRVLLEAWVPAPRLVVVGDGELLAAIDAQAVLLGWETQGTGELENLESLLEWAGVSGALIVLSHDPHVDVPALAAGLTRTVGYIGALGSRRTQSRRTEQLTGLGIGPAELARLHRPIGLDLGGRRAPEVALAIVAEILACYHGRTGTPLRDTSGPIHG